MECRVFYFIFCLLINIGISGQRFSKKTVEQDFDFLYHSLQDTHYNLYAYQDKQAYDRLFYSLKSGIKDSMSFIETVSLYQNLTSFSNTGHCEIDFPAGSYIQYAQEGGTLFPLELAFENNRTFIRKNFSSNNKAAIGDQLLSIDKVPVRDLIKKVYPLISAERSYFKNAKIEFWSFPRLWFQHYGKKNFWDLEIKNNKNQIFITRLNSISVMEYEEKRNGEILNPQKILKFYGKTAYLKPGFLSSADPDGLYLFKKYIDSTFDKIRNNQTRNLIIDLRNNPGGDNDYSDYLISYFASKPFKWYSRFSIKTSAILKDYTKKSNDTLSSFAQTILKGKDGDIIPVDLPAQQPMEQSKRFKGKIYILINRQTYSMAAVSAALIQDYKFGTIVGEETGDTPTLYASQFSFQLPETKINVKVPKGYIIRPDGDEHLKGVVPDIAITDHLLDDHDEIVEGLLLRLNSVKKNHL
ncbi:peptidase S41 [Chryseobacterium phosphatilyticum]|uniref:Peptidase S41 n=1 Tax=Chryseobacterium phosphatilyticum TaxID=475075 RepID=A0A316XIC7_9FLAO|nr:S41 family peptidase [Chryseobacterium phosphatilyticum]PWN70570.1 peptidase S41 [Chryseobacterium phosphatilyticum]